MAFGVLHPVTPVRSDRGLRRINGPLTRVYARIGILLVAGCLAVVGPTVAAGPRWDAYADTIFRHYTEDQGLPVPPVTALAQDGAGFIWLGTQSGLARFDGYRFKKFIPQPGKPGALPGSYVTALHTDSQGRLWIGTAAGGLARIEDADHFIVYNLKQGGLSGIDVRAITDDGEGGIWVATEGGLDHLNAKGTLLPRSKNASIREPSAIQALLHGRNGTLWVGTHTGLFRRNTDSRLFVPVLLTHARKQTLSVTTLYEDSSGRLWIGTARNGVFVKDAAVKLPHPLRKSGVRQIAFATADVHVIANADPNTIWIGTYGQGIYTVDTRTFTIRRLHHDPRLAGSLMHDDIWALLRDRSGSMWVGDGYALEQVNDGSGAILTLLGGDMRSHGLSGSDVSAVYATTDGRVWFGYRSGAVDIFDPERGRVTHLAPNPARPESALPEGYVRAFAVAGSTMYIGTTRGLYRSDLAGRNVKRVQVSGRDATALVATLCVDAGTLWIGGHDKGVFALPLISGIKPVVTHLDAGELTDARISDIVRGRGPYLWIATYNGLNRLDLDNGRVEQIHAAPAQPDALTASVVTALLMDRAGRLWVGMIGGGIAVMQGGSSNAPHFHRIGTAEGLPNANIDALVEDQAGQVWASTDNGLAVINPATFSVHALHRAAGAVIRTYWTRSAAITPKGALVFGGNGGATVVRPRQLVTWNFHPPIVVTDLRVGGRERAWTPGQPINIPAADNKFAVEFAALDYTAPERNHYAYRLDGFDHDWIQTDALHRLATYTNLPPGDYQLRLRGSNRVGVWNEGTVNLPIVVEAAWYQTFVFKLLMALALIVIIVVLVEIRTAYLRRRQLHLEQQVQERTAEIERERSTVKRLEQAERLQRALYDIAELTSSSIERNEMLRRIHKIVAGLMYAENFFIALHDRDRRTLRYVYFADTKDPWEYDPEQEIPEQELTGGATLPLIRLGKPARGTSLEIRHRLGISRTEGSGPEADAWLGVPMIAAGEVRGAIVVQSYNKAIEYSEADQELLMFVAGHILTALMRRQAKEDMEGQIVERTRELAQANRDLTTQIRERESGERLQALLFRIAELSSNGGHVADFLKAVHGEISKLLYAQNFYVGLLVEDGKALEYPYAVDERDPGTLFQRGGLGHGLTEYVLRSGKPLLAFPDTIQALVDAGEVDRTGTPSVCWLGVPLVVGDRIAGVLVVQSYSPGVVYSARDQELLTFVSLHLATALQRRQAQESLKLAYEQLQGRIEELRRTQSELIENEKMASLGRLVAGVAHEINTPLGIGVTAATHLVEIFSDIQRKLATDPNQASQAVLSDGRRCVELILSNLGKADHLVKSFKQVAVDQSNEESRRISVKAYLDDVLVSLGPRLKRTPHRVLVDCPPTLELVTLPGALYQIVANMIINALMHAFDDTRPGQVRIGVRRLDGSVEMRFTDDGRGMSEEVRLKVFDPFFTTRRGTGGTGLGLHLVYNLVTQLLHGSIECQSAPGQGTTFIIRLPSAVAT